MVDGFLLEKKVVFLYNENNFKNCEVIKMTIVGTTNNFEALVLNSQEPVLVDFWAAWCGPCLRSKPILEKLSEELDGLVKVVLVNVDENPQLADKYEILSIPTLVLFKEGKLVDVKVGVHSIQTLKEFINL